MHTAVAEREQYLTQESQSRQRLLDALAHEMRTPLCALLGNTRLLQNPSVTGETRRQLAETMASDIKRLSDMDRQLLMLTGLAHEAPQFTSVAVLPLLGDTVRRVRQQAQGITLVAEGEESVIPGDSELLSLMFSTNVGIINQVLQAVGIISSPIDWLTSPVSAMAAVIIANVWIGIPFNMILLSVGLTTIPGELRESAAIDGAGRWQCFRHITLPLLRPTIESVLVLGFIYTFKVFDLVFVMTNGGPVNATQLLSTYSYKLSFSLFKYSEGAAAANVLFVILLAASLVYLKYTDAEEEGM